MEKHSPPDALMLLGSHCPYCPGVLAALNELLKSGALGRLEAVNVEQHPEVARRLGVRGVPWVRIGEFELEGNHSAAELAEWTARAGLTDGLLLYFREQLDSGQLTRVTQMIRRRPEQLNGLLQLMKTEDLPLNVRLGISAVVEDFAGEPTLQSQLPLLIELCADENPAIRTDAAHFLALSGDSAALPVLLDLGHDPDPAVREIAADGLASLQP